MRLGATGCGTRAARRGSPGFMVEVRGSATGGYSVSAYLSSRTMRGMTSRGSMVTGW